MVVLNVLMVVQDVRMRVRDIPMRVLMSVLCSGHRFAPFLSCPTGRRCK